MSNNLGMDADQGMIDRAANVLHNLYGDLYVKSLQGTKYADVDGYVKAMTRVHAELVLDAAFHDLARLSYSTEEQVRAEKKVLGTPVDRAHGCGTVQWWMDIHDVPTVMGKFIRDKAGHLLVCLSGGWLYLDGPDQDAYIKCGDASDVAPFMEVI